MPMFLVTRMKRGYAVVKAENEQDAIVESEVIPDDDFRWDDSVDSAEECSEE